MLQPVSVEPVVKEGNVFRRTHIHQGRRTAITPENSSMRHLCYSRIILGSSVPRVNFSSEGRELALICLSGTATVTIDATSLELAQYDSVYVPRGRKIQIDTKSNVDLAEFAADVQGDYPVQVVRYADLLQDSSLHFTAGSAATTRTLNIMIGKNVKAGRVLAGFTLSEPGNWTSWPPHEHAAMLEEMYVYTEMPAPGFGIQLVYTDTQEPELVTIVREGDAVLMPRGYHPNVAGPGGRIGFLWAMAAHREGEDRQFGVVNVQPEFSQAGTGLEASRR